MAAAVPTLRLCLRASRQLATPRGLGAAPAARITPYVARRHFSGAQTRWYQRRPWTNEDFEEATRELEGMDEEEEGEEPEGEFEEGGEDDPGDLEDDDDEGDDGEYPGPQLSEETKQKIRDQMDLLEMLAEGGEWPESDFSKQFLAISKDLDHAFGDAAKTPPLKQVQRRSFWNEEEEDTDFITDVIDDDDFVEDEITSMAHGKLEEHREYREYARITAWQMPLLSKLAQDFQPPSANEVLRFRYTTYLGEDHPAAKKVVVEFSPRDLPLGPTQRLKLRKLLGPRWNPETDIAKMSCEQFDHQAQNKRYLADMVGKLIEKAKDPTDMFEDVPLDTRHHKFKIKPKFPKEWRMTEERMRFIEAQRNRSRLLDRQREEAGTLIDGAQKTKEYIYAGTPVVGQVAASPRSQSPRW